MRFWLAPLLLLCALAGYACWSHGGAARARGVVAAEAPAQHDLVDASPVTMGHFVLQPRATFDMDARLLSREDYQLDELAPISPTDFALGWGRMSDNSVLHHIRISQSNRLYDWYARENPVISRDEILNSSANMHMVPANDAIAARLRDIRPGDVVHVKGMLVDVRRDDGWRVTTSLVRNDDGPAGCEIVLVQALDQ